MQVKTKAMVRAGTMAMAAVLLLGCVPQSGSPPAEPLPVEDACGAAGLQGLVGQSEEALATLSLAAPARVIRPGMAVTMDYRAERLNIELDSQGRIIRIFCG